MQSFATDGTRLVWTGDGETLVVEPWGHDSLRVRAVPLGDVTETGYALLPQPPSPVEIAVAGASATIEHGRIRARLTETVVFSEVLGRDVFRCSAAFYDRSGKLLLREVDAGGSLNLRSRDWHAHVAGGFALTASFDASDEKLYGMGQYQQHVMDLKGCTLELAHRNSQASVPFVLSSRGYGFLWHNPAVGRATFATNRTEWFASATGQLDYWITAGDTPAQITQAYADATGHAPMMPERGLGYWQCKLRYWNQEQLLQVAREHKRRGLPMDVIVADFFHWPHMGDYRFDEEFWPDPQAMVDELRSLGIELMVSVWPQVALDSENYPALAKGNMLVKSDRGLDVQMAFEGPSVFLDVTNPAARAFLWDRCRENYARYGIRTFWLDEAEPEFGVYDYDNYRYHLGPVAQVGNLYPQLFARALYDGLTQSGQTEVVNLVRCAWAGSQRYGALVWSGDIHSTFEDLRRQITAGIHMGVAGIPWFTTDIGGFHGGDSQDPAFRELLVRWFQFATFCPVMRMHGDRLPYEQVTAADGSRKLRSGAPNELWSFGDDVYQILARYVHVREAMRPYTRRAMAEAHRSGQPVMRALFHEFPEDRRCWDVDDEYLFGADLLVAPITESGLTEREVYLPAGCRWQELLTGDRHDGGQVVAAEAPLGVIPVYARETIPEDLLSPVVASLRHRGVR